MTDKEAIDLMMDILRFPRYYRYPYCHWGKTFASLLANADIANDADIVDAPCGDGVVTFWLIKNGIQRNFELVDLAERDVNRARKLIEWSTARTGNLDVSCADVHEVSLPAGRTRDVWFLINSLFLLPDIDVLIQRMRPRIEHIVGLFPDVNSRNYQCYKKRNPTMNANEMDRDQIRDFFAKHGYATKATMDASYIPHHCIQPMRVQQITRYALNPFGNLVSKKDPCYWAGLFTRQ